MVAGGCFSKICKISAFAHADMKLRMHRRALCFQNASRQEHKNARSDDTDPRGIAYRRLNAAKLVRGDQPGRMRAANQNKCLMRTAERIVDFFWNANMMCPSVFIISNQMVSCAQNFDAALGDKADRSVLA